MKKPNFFIIGAPKCGTTSMASYLSEHPAIFMTVPKEPHFFATDFKKIRVAKSEKQYKRLYADVSREHTAIGEASTTYLCSYEAIQNIYKFNSSAKIIVMLRNPSDLFVSLHSHYLYHGIELEKDPLLAWKRPVEETKKLSDASYIDYALLDYQNVLCLGKQLKKLFEIFPSSQIKVILFDDFVSSPAAAYEEVLSFLGLASDGRKSFMKINRRRKHKYLWLANIEQVLKKTYRNSPFYYRITQIKKATNFVGGRSFWEEILQFNTVNTDSQESKKISSNLKNEIVGLLDSDIMLLSKVLGTELQNWQKLE